MRHRIDLHGLSHNEASKKVESELINISLSEYWEVEIITGNSKPMKDKIIKGILDPMNYFYYIPHTNTGVIIVVDDDLLN
jgi:hypothetical protein